MTTLRHILSRARRIALRASLVLLCAAALAAAAIAVLWVAYPFPREKLERWPVSPAVFDAHGRPMLCLAGPDGQWRLPVKAEGVSPWLAQATVAVEDHRFNSHPGVDALAVLRAAGSDLAGLHIASGASTLDMQVCRMMDGRRRTLWAKAVESFRALQLDRIMTKREILAAYLSIAPYGGNVRGAEAASLVYFGKHACDLSLAEAALLAGLPQSPTHLRPDRHLAAAQARQRFVLARMAAEGFITDQQRRAAESDPLVLAPTPPPPRATHAAFLALHRRPLGGRTTIDLDIQAEVQRLADERRRVLPDGTDQAVVVIDVAASAIVAMIGSSDAADAQHGQVNGVLARRSPGSALKPLLYAAAFEAGRLNAESTVYDVPIRRAGWAPENFDRTFAGPLPAGEALRRSLNVPAILVAEGTGLARCCGVLEAAGVHLPAGAQARGGLALAVGGIEVTLLDLTNAYATLGRGGIRRTPRLLAEEDPCGAGILLAAASGTHGSGDAGKMPAPQAIDRNVCAAINDILSTRHRRPAGMESLAEADVPWLMWKTGTSAARRDAWAVGHNTRYAAGVWVGRFRGSGRIEFVGARAAEPLLAAILALPQLRQVDAPPAPQPIVVRNPLPVPAEAARRICITAPCEGETFIALTGAAVIRPQTNVPGGLRWFLNGRLIAEQEAQRLSLPPGRYELRCVDAAGQASAVRFVVRPADEPA